MGIPRVALPPRHRYTVLLAVLTASVVMQSLRTAGGVAGIALDVFATVLAVVIFVAIFRGTREERAMGAVLGAIVLIGWLRDALPAHHGRTTAIVFQVLMVLYLGCAVAAILRDLYRGDTPGMQNILGAICGYLIAGAVFCSVNIIAYLAVPSSYSVAPAVDDLAADWHGRTALFSYYSFTQLLTIGYADVTPLRAPATTLSLVAGIFGIFYTAVVVSQLVAVAQAGKNRGDD